jgi:hypothetical protein
MVCLTSLVHMSGCFARISVNNYNQNMRAFPSVRKGEREVGCCTVQDLLHSTQSSLLLDHKSYLIGSLTIEKA